jgi:hypothetical protein
MTWNKMLGSRTAYAAALAALGTALLVVANVAAPGWRVAGWVVIAAITSVLLAIAANVFYALVWLETGYLEDRRNVMGSGSAKHSPAAPVGWQVNRRTANAFAGGLGRQSPQFQDIMADLSAAEYLLGKVQGSSVLAGATGEQRRDCDQALGRIRRLLDELMYQAAERKVAS